MTHDIQHPTNWPLLDELHTFLWKRFPMDRFEFNTSAEETAPKYAGTEMSSSEAAPLFPGLHRHDSFFEDVKDAVEAFLESSVPARMAA